MKGIFLAILLVCVLSGYVSAQEGSAAETKPVQLALFNPAQIFDESYGIAGVRLNLLYGKNIFVRGLDVGLVNVCGRGESVGLQWGIAGFVEGNYLGLQLNMFNITEGDFSGFQWGIYNSVNTSEAFQLGFVNVAKEARGLQLGFVNYTETMYGLQVGLVNVIRKKETLPVFIFVNWSF